MAVLFTSIIIEALFRGAYMKITASGCPSEMIDKLKELDPDVKFKDSFPVYGRGGGGRGGSKDTKKAKVLSISVSGNNGSKFINLACECSDGDFTVAVSKKKVEDFLTGAKERIGAEHRDKLDQSSATIIFRLDDQMIPISYFEIEDKKFFDSFDGGSNGN